MSKREKVFVSQASPSRPEVEWSQQFADALRRYGLDVFEEWRLDDNPSQQEVEDYLRGSDLIVLLLDADSATSPTFFFEFGVALGSGKRFVAVVPDDLDPGTLPIPLRDGSYLRKGTPQETARALASIFQVRQPA